MVDQGGTTAVERLAIGGLLIGGTSLPTPAEETAPLAGQSAHSGLMRLPFVTWRLVIEPRPERLPERRRRPLAARVPEALGALEAPVPPGLLAAACGARCAPGIFWQCGGGAIAGALCAKGAAPPGGAAGPCSWERLEQGDIRRALSPRRDGGVAGRHGLHGDPALVDQGLAAPGMGSDNALIGGQGEGCLEGVSGLCDAGR
jgi:hypothetical protein